MDFIILREKKLIDCNFVKMHEHSRASVEPLEEFSFKKSSF